MREIQLVNGQRSNTCTITSLFAIHAILSTQFKEPQDLKPVFEALMLRAQTIYAEMLVQNPQYGAGVSPQEFFDYSQSPQICLLNTQTIHFSQNAANTEEKREYKTTLENTVGDFFDAHQNLTSKSDREKAVNDFLGELYTLYAEAIDKTQADINFEFFINDGSIPIISYKEIIDTPQSKTPGRTPTIFNAFNSIFTERVGIIATSSEGHTIAISMKDGFYYLFDPNSGILRITEFKNDRISLVKYLSEIWKNCTMVSIAQCQCTKLYIPHTGASFFTDNKPIAPPNKEKTLLAGKIAAQISVYSGKEDITSLAKIILLEAALSLLDDPSNENLKVAYTVAKNKTALGGFFRHDTRDLIKEVDAYLPKQNTAQLRR
ncbi:MAG: hypothetical protein A3E82_05255 [Gammaproteobacteria bacterium RIFCSPHIGHO2_12_FULL_38_11]|nr:MAG: hypothetical protein A3E82_05255 [Gammaproteobacteria bacterium RIFCSPHIGHO2_12_FULL_38_11]